MQRLHAIALICLDLALICGGCSSAPPAASASASIRGAARSSGDAAPVSQVAAPPASRPGEVSAESSPAGAPPQVSAPVAVALAPVPVMPAPVVVPAPKRVESVEVTASQVPLTRIEMPDEPPVLATLDLTSQPDDLLDRIRNGFSMPNLESPLVAERQAWYLNRPAQLRELLERSRRYLHHIVTELEARGMPTELALLPMVESAFDPKALSRSQASGLWQFVPGTGRDYNLAQNWWVDQRRDVVASTHAALEYLQSIYEMHGDWHLALASYNWGENAVARAIQKNQAAGLPTDFLSLNMPTETRYYVPKLQALKNIIAHPEVFGIVLPKIPNRPYFVPVEARGKMDIATAARLANMSVQEFTALNPAYNRPVMPHGENGRILIPAQNVETYQANLEAHDKPLSNWTTYTVSRTDRLDVVAARFSLTPARLREINGLPARAVLRPGQGLLVPANVEPLAVKPVPALPAKAAVVAAKPAAKAVAAKKAVVAKKPAKAVKASAKKPAGKPAQRGAGLQRT